MSNQNEIDALFSQTEAIGDDLSAATDYSSLDKTVHPSTGVMAALAVAEKRIEIRDNEPGIRRLTMRIRGRNRTGAPRW